MRSYRNVQAGSALFPVEFEENSLFLRQKTDLSAETGSRMTGSTASRRGQSQSSA